MKPIIGIVEWPYEDKDTDRIYEIPSNIASWIIKSGGIPIGIFPGQAVNYYDTPGREIPSMTKQEKMDTIKALNMCHGIIKPGATRIYNFDRFIYEYACDNNIPFLGICAGMQMMATTFEGNDIIERNEDNSHMSREPYVHYVNILKDSKLSEILKKSSIVVSSAHNYHIKDCESHVVSALSGEGLIEAIESYDMDFGIGVQWHPENAPYEDENSQNLFGEFIGYARKRIYKKR